MEHAIVKDPLIPIRFAPSDRSEMTDQILFGEFFQIFDEQGDWCFIKNKLNNYTGWINKKHRYTSVSDDEYRNRENLTKITSKPLTIIEDENCSNTLTIPGGSMLPNYREENKSFHLGDEKYIIHTSTSDDKEDSKEQKILSCAKQYLNAPYLWGGKTLLGMDCSGFVQVIFRMAGINIPRDSSEQVKYGEGVGFIDQAKPGDVAFFDNEEGNIIHTGILLNKQEIIHASGRVRIDLIDHQGIYNKETHQYSHKLRIIKQFLTR
ncbi:MAG: NlpC/P60 family protein [Bacteroidota bacterium]